MTMYNNVSHGLINIQPVRSDYCSYLWRFFSFAFSNLDNGWLLHARCVRHPEATRSKRFIYVNHLFKTPRSNNNKILYQILINVHLVQYSDKKGLMVISFKNNNISNWKNKKLIKYVSILLLVPRTSKWRISSNYDSFRFAEFNQFFLTKVNMAFNLKELDPKYVP